MIFMRNGLAYMGEESLGQNDWQEQTWIEQQEILCNKMGGWALLPHGLNSRRYGI